MVGKVGFPSDGLGREILIGIENDRLPGQFTDSCAGLFEKAQTRFDGAIFAGCDRWRREPEIAGPARSCAPDEASACSEI